jgi:hypothetical protein
MKKTLLLALGIFVAAFTASAATITSNCNLFPVTFMNGTGGPTGASCPGFTASPGNVLTSVSLTYSADYQFGGAGTNTVAVTFVPTGPTNNYSPLNVTLNPSGSVSSGAVPTTTATYTGALTNALFASPFNVNISSSVVQGTVATSSGAASVTYTFAASTIPEPATYGLMGSAISLLFVKRRRKQS